MRGIIFIASVAVCLKEQNILLTRNPKPDENLKKLLAIAILPIFLFNIGGYYLMFYALRHQAGVETWSRLEAGQYSDEETVLLKIPMALPYPVSEGIYEKMQEEFEHNGEFYKGIMRKMENDTLFVLCVKDQKEKHLAGVMNGFEKIVNDFSAKSKQGQILLSKVIKEYESFHQPEVVAQQGWTMTVPFVTTTSNLIAFERSVQSPPPKHLS